MRQLPGGTVTLTGFVLWDRDEHERCVAAARARGDDVAFAAAWRAGRELAIEDAAALVLDSIGEPQLNSSSVPPRT